MSYAAERRIDAYMMHSRLRDRAYKLYWLNLDVPIAYNKKKMGN